MLPLSPFLKVAVSFIINIFFWDSCLNWTTLRVDRLFNIHVTFVHFIFYPWTFQEVPKTTLASKLTAKAATVPETPKCSKEHKRCQNQRKWLKFHLHWKRKNVASVVLWREMVLGHLVQRKSCR